MKVGYSPGAPGRAEERRPYQRIEPPRGFVALNLAQVWRFRDLLATLAGRDIKLRYRQTVLGVLWVLLQPILSAGILTFVFNVVAGLKTGGIPPFIFAFAGQLSYTLFSSVLTKASTSLVGNAQMISKVYFPRLILPLSVTLSSFLDLGIGFVVMVALLLAKGLVPSWGLLLLPLWTLLITLFALGAGLFFGALMVSYRDVQYVVPVIIGLLNFATPVAYSLSDVLRKIPSAYHPLYFVLNPLASLVSAFRWSLLGVQEVSWGWVAFSSLVSVAVFVVGAYSFKKMEGRLADVI